MAPHLEIGPRPEVDPDETSSLAEDSLHEEYDWKEDTNVFETQEVVIENPMPVCIHIRGAPRDQCAAGRKVVDAYLDRMDVGCYGIYVGSWSGRCKLQVVSDHIAADVCVRNPAQVLIAQEVDWRFIETLSNPAGSEEASSRPHTVNIRYSPTAVGTDNSADYEKRYANLKPWHVATGEEGWGSEATTLIIAAHSEKAKSSTMVE